ncbi:melatonin receptor type 1B-A-like [Amphiura filiformis]|uniref:melatonin receptor type 1B-A-like n=1 Tax=Amphiura filiformis TaxID=82378 RepID=UPI003B216765
MSTQTTTDTMEAESGNNTIDSIVKRKGSNMTVSYEPLPDSQLPILYTYISLTIFLSLVGTAGNILVILAVLTSQKLRVLHNVFIVNLAVADLLVTALVNPFAIVGALDINLFYTLPAFCEFLATLVITSCGCSIWSISSVSLNRYFYICHRMIYTKIYNQHTVPFMVIGLWFIAFLIDLPNYLGWGDHIFDTRNFLCTYDYAHNFFYTRGYVTVLAFAMPVCILCFTYFRIFMVFRGSNRRMQQYATNPLSNQNQEKLKAADKRLLKTVGIICIVFMLMWTPYFITVIFDLDYHFWWFFTATFMALNNSSVNFLIYATDRNFLQAYSDIWKRYVGRCPCLVTKRGERQLGGRSQELIQMLK